jgi:hypothetical protein
MCRLTIALALFGGTLVADAATFTVTNTFDSGAGSLRQAILDANATFGNDDIAFAIPGPGVACPSLFADWIEQLKAENVTTGCGNGTVYCPANPNTRGQMATFLVKALRLP